MVALDPRITKRLAALREIVGETRSGLGEQKSFSRPLHTPFGAQSQAFSEHVENCVRR